MVTYDKRYEYLKESVKYFNNQTYPNKELIIVIDNNEEYYQKIYEEYSSDNILVYSGLEDDVVGLRNMSLQKSNGEYVTLWDDDDEFHPKRLETQMWPIIYFRHDASILQSFKIRSGDEIKFVNWKDGVAPSLLYKKDKEIFYKTLDGTYGEDVFVLNIVAQTQKLFYIKQNSELFTYNLHKDNRLGLDLDKMKTYKCAVKVND